MSEHSLYVLSPSTFRTADADHVYTRAAGTVTRYPLDGLTLDEPDHPVQEAQLLEPDAVLQAADPDLRA